MNCRRSLSPSPVADSQPASACTPCVKARGYEQQDLLDGVIITGASVMHEEIKKGAATLSF